MCAHPLCAVFQPFYIANFDAQAEIGMAFAFPNIPHYSILCLNIQFEYSVVPPLLTLSKKDALLLNIEPKIIDPLSNEKVTKLFINNDFNVFIQQAIDLEKEKDKFSMNTKLKINNTIKDVKITVQVIYDGEEALGILGDIEIL